MNSEKAHIISQLQKDLLVLQGFKHHKGNHQQIPDLGPVNDSFPNRKFPLGAMHEFIANTSEEKAASLGFINGLLSTLLNNGGVAIWIGSNLEIYPPSLVEYGIDADKIIFISVRNEKEAFYCMEESLKCDGLSVVLADLKDLDFTISRRFQLAVEQSRVTGFIIRPQPKRINTTACITRWNIKHLPGIIYNGMPGLGHPQWEVNLLKVRNGLPGTWDLQWFGKKFIHVQKPIAFEYKGHLKTG